MKKVIFYFLIDAANDDMRDYSMKIAHYINEIIPILNEAEEKYYSKVSARIMVYEECASWFDAKDEALSLWIPKHIKCTGKSEFGNALNLLGTDLANIDESVCPIIIHLPSKDPTDDFTEIISKLEHLEAYSNALRISIDLGNEYNRDNAYRFTGSSIHILPSDNMQLLKHFTLGFIEDYYRNHDEDYYKVRIDSLGISIRSINHFKRCGCETVGDIFNNKKRECFYLGRRDIEELLTALEEKGYILGTK